VITAIDVDRRADRLSVIVGGRADAFLVGTFAFVVSAAGAGAPSLWLDEAATISSSTRTLPQLWQLLGHVDAVHGLHYVLMHVWFAIFPATEFAARVPSSMLVGGAAAGVVVLGRQLSTRSVAIASGVVFAVLPRTTWAGVEARSYALSMFDAVWLTALCVVAVRRNRGWIWGAYLLGLAFATVANVFVLFVVGAHAVLAVGLGRSPRITGRWASAVVAATALISPFLLLIKSQQFQVDWIWRVGPGTIGQVLGDQYFPVVYSSSARATGLDPHQKITPEQVSAALHAWALVLPFIIAVVAVTVVATIRRRRVAAPIGDGARLLGWTAVTWVVGPTALLVGYSIVREPLYQPHYLSFTVPGLALLLGMCVVIVGRSPRRIAIVLAIVVAAAVPNYLAQRGPYAKFGADYSQVAGLIATHAATGDCLNVDDTAPTKVVGALKASRPTAYAALHDYGQGRSAVSRSALFESRVPIAEWSTKVPTCHAMWTITQTDASLPAHEAGDRLAPGAKLATTTAYRVPTEFGFRIVEQWQFNVIRVVKSIR
jgi:mannosyltransferase